MVRHACLAMEPMEGYIQLAEKCCIQRGWCTGWRRVNHRHCDVHILDCSVQSTMLLSPYVVRDEQSTVSPRMSDVRAFFTKRRANPNMSSIAAMATGTTVSRVRSRSTIWTEGGRPVPLGVVAVFLVFRFINPGTLSRISSDFPV